MAESLHQNRQQDLDHEGELLKFLHPSIFPIHHQPQLLSSLSSSRHNHLNYSNSNYYNRSCVHHTPSCMDLSQGLAAFSFIGRSPQPPRRFDIMPAPNLLFRRADQRSFPGFLPDRCCCVCGGCVVGANEVRQYGAGPGWPSYGPGRNPSQADRFMEERARTLQAMQHHSWVNRATENQIFPSRGGGAGATGVGFIRGTGVYLPRIPANSSSTTANHIDHRRRRQGARSRRREDEAQFLMNAAVHKKKQEDCRNHASPEVGLPEDWTY